MLRGIRTAVNWASRYVFLRPPDAPPPRTPTAARQAASDSGSFESAARSLGPDLTGGRPPPAQRLWERTAPVMLEGPRGKQLPITFSHDTEVLFDETLEFVQRRPEAFARVAAMAKQVPSSHFQSVLQMSPKQFNIFALRKGVDRRQTETLSVLDLNPAHFYSYVERVNGTPAFKEIEPLLIALTEEVRVALSSGGLSLESHIDPYGCSEFTHASSEQNPSAFRSQVMEVHRPFKTPGSHVHLGLPSEVVSKPQATAIARALATRTMIAIAAESPKAGKWPQPTNRGSVLSGDGWKGLLALYFDRFKQPVPAHDLEIRRGRNLQHALELGEFGVRLAQQHDQLEVSARRFGNGAQDPYWGDIQGALDYAGTMLSRAIDPERRMVGEGLLALTEEVCRHQPAPRRINEHDLPQRELPPDLRKKVHEFIKRNQVEELLAQDQVFLKPAR
jgi:hypothetical protein